MLLESGFRAGAHVDFETPEECGVQRRQTSNDLAAASPAPRTAIATLPRRGARTSAFALLRATRPKQWLKNLLVLAAPGAAGALTEPHILGRAAAATGLFVLASAATYLLNDVVDAHADRAHPAKRHRPIAAGRLSPRVALAAAAILLAGAAAGSIPLGAPFAGSLGAYVAVTAAYTLWLKRVAVIDIAVVASGFVLRAVAGGLATGVPNSEWFLLLTSFGSLFVVAGKRGSDLLVAEGAAEEIAVNGRAAIGYTREFLRFVWMLAATLSITAYCLWIFAPHSRGLEVMLELSAVPFVLAILRYALLLESGHGGAPEDLLLGDRGLQVLVLAWLLVYGGGLYLGR